MSRRRTIGAGAAAALGLLLLAGCMLLPGRFASELSLRRDGTFSYYYKGEIYLTALAEGSAKAKEAAEDAKFEPQPCTNPETDETRPCTSAELATQRQEWAKSLADEKARKEAQDAAGRRAVQAMLGGIDPADPRAAQEFADRLARQKGWTSVVSRGEGKFDVEYTVSGRLDHDFTFPTIEGLPLVIPFVAVIRRNDGTVRMEAPGLTPGSANPGIPGFTDAPTARGKPDMPLLDGTLTLRTDGEILANNTDTGPRPDATVGGPASRRLDWKVNARTKDAPTALVRLGG